MQSAEMTPANGPTGLLFTLRQRIADAICPELRERRESAERAANFDSLTGLASRRAFDLALPCAESDPGTAVLCFDVNNFKAVNDTAGHIAGDAALREVARSVFTAARAHGFGARVFRSGGDEFAVLCSTETAESIRNFAEALFGVRRVGGFAVSLSGTFGGSYFEADSQLQARKSEAKGA